MELTFKQCVLDDLHRLHDLSCRTYSETFSHMNTPSNMKAYLEQSFDINKLRGELSDSRSVFYFLFADGKLAGYLKLNESPVQTDISDIQSLEIERIYVAKEFQGVFCKSEFPVFARIPNNFPPGKFVNELSLANS